MNRAIVVDTSSSPNSLLQPVGVGEVSLDDRFWAPRRLINREKTIPQQYRQCEATGRIDNFRRASGQKKDSAYHGALYNDSDVYKLLEAAAWTLATDKDPALEKLIDGLIVEIAAAQQPDGYIDTFFMFDKAGERFKDLKTMHELYCQGHLMQAAVAHHRATGKTALLDVARKSADHICDYFGPKNSGKHEGVPGHPELEMALIELARHRRRKVSEAGSIFYQRPRARVDRWRSLSPGSQADSRAGSHGGACRAQCVPELRRDGSRAGAGGREAEIGDGSHLEADDVACPLHHWRTGRAGQRRSLWRRL